MDSMDYQLDVSPARPAFRCPYAFQTNSNPNYFQTHQFQNRQAYPPSHHYHNPLAWAHATYPLLPPPMPTNTNINIHNHYGHPQMENLPRGPEPSTPQVTNMAESAADVPNFSSPWIARAIPWENSPPRVITRGLEQPSPQTTNMAESAADLPNYRPAMRIIPWNNSPERPVSTSSESSSTSHVYGGNSNTFTRSNDHNDRTFPSRTLPPIVSSVDRYTLPDTATRSEQETGRIQTQNQESVPNGRDPIPHSSSGIHSRNPPNARSAHTLSLAAAASISRHPIPLSDHEFRPYGYGRRPLHMTTESAAPTHDDDSLTPAEMAMLEDPLFRQYLEHQVPLLQIEDRLRMDDPARLDHSAMRLRALREIMSQGRLPSKKTGASKAALESLVKVPIAELKEDDRSCQICYNDYGVENPDGEKEDPIRMPKCKHTFGEACLKKWLEDKSTCPYCRDQLPSEPHHRARRPFADPRRMRTEHSSREYLTASARLATRASGPHTPRIGMAWTESRRDYSDDLASLRRSEAVLQDMERMAEINRERVESRAATAARRARGRPSSGRATHSTTPSDSPPMPMRVPIVSAPGSYEQRQNHSGRAPGTGQNIAVASGISRVSATGTPNQDTSSTWSISAGNFSANPHLTFAAPYPANYTVSLPAQQNENLDQNASFNSRGYEQFIAANAYNRPTGSNIYAHEFPDLDGTYLPTLPTHLTSLQAVEADGERRTLQSISQQVSDGQSPNERHSNDSQSTEPYSDDTLHPHFTFNDSILRTRGAQERLLQGEHQSRQTQNAALMTLRGSYLDDRYPGTMPPPSAHIIGEVEILEQVQRQEQVEHHGQWAFY